MKEARYTWCLFHRFYSISRQPVEDLEEEQSNEANDESRVEFIPKDGQGQQALSDCVPYSFVQPFQFNESQRTKEDLLKEFPSDYGQEDTKVPQDKHARIALAQVDSSREEVGSLLERKQDYPGGQ